MGRERVARGGDAPPSRLARPSPSRRGSAPRAPAQRVGERTVEERERGEVTPRVHGAIPTFAPGERSPLAGAHLGALGLKRGRGCGLRSLALLLRSAQAQTALEEASHMPNISQPRSGAHGRRRRATGRCLEDTRRALVGVFGLSSAWTATTPSRNRACSAGFRPREEICASVTFTRSALCRKWGATAHGRAQGGGRCTGKATSVLEPLFCQQTTESLREICAMLLKSLGE